MLDQAMLSEPLAPKQKEYVGNVLSASNQLLRLIDDILDLATIEAGRMTLDLSEMDVARGLEWAVGVATKRAQEGKLSLELKLEEGLGRIQADERRVKQVVFNLLQNAIAFTPPGGRVTVSASRSGSELRLTVADTGQGIAPRAQATVFDRFEAKGSDGRRGAGLGLSLVKSFVQLHGGWVELESEPGKGTRVTCHLPERARLPLPAQDRDAAE
jgi:signal transduction histidine kinase